MISNQADITQISQGLASIDLTFRQKSMRALQNCLPRTNQANYKKIATGLFYFFYYSDGFSNQASDRASITNLLEIVPDQLKAEWMQSFLISIVNFWYLVDQHRTDKYLKLLRDFFTGVYKYLNTTPDSRSKWLQWNDFLSESVIFNSSGNFRRNAGNSTISLRFA